MGVSTSAHPCCQAFALPPLKDKQRSQPTPSEYNHSIAPRMKTWLIDLIHPRKRFRCITSVSGSKLRSLTTQNSNVRKRLFPLACQPETRLRFTNQQNP